MRRAEAEQEAAWRNAHDERRTRLEFYAFDASAGLADDAWEVTMRLVRARAAEPPPAPVAAEPAESAQVQVSEPSPAATEAVEPWVGQPTAAWDTLEAMPVDAPARAAEDWPADEGAEEWAEAFPATAPARPPSRPRRPRPTSLDEALEAPRRPRRLRLRRSREDEAAEPQPQRGRLERLTRFVGAGVILMAVLWVGMVVTLAVLIGSTSVTGLAILAGSLVLGALAIGLGLLIRRT